MKWKGILEYLLETSFSSAYCMENKDRKIPVICRQIFPVRKLRHIWAKQAECIFPASTIMCQSFCGEEQSLSRKGWIGSVYPILFYSYISILVEYYTILPILHSEKKVQFPSPLWSRGEENISFPHNACIELAFILCFSLYVYF